MCHAPRLAAAAAVLMLLIAGCGPRRGWVRAERVCQAEDPPWVCFDADPDAPLTLEVGGETLVPGECVLAPKKRWVMVPAVVVDGRDGGRYRQRVESAPGETAHVVVTRDDGELEIDVVRGDCS